ncbi:MAG: hydrogenase expression/formation protein HypE [Planctomycetota bacterium]|jgi:hydrogenase expression/formation protein HypE
MSSEPDFTNSSCPVPLRDYSSIVLGHGGGGKLSSELVEHLFLPAFRNAALENLGDSSVVEVGDQRLAFSTDSFVVRPLFFPGGSIGDLAVNGTVNDLAMSGAQPLFLSVGLIIEEGLSVEILAAVTQQMAEAAERAGVVIVTGDTKVVEKGHGDGLYINTSGIGVVPDGVDIGPQNAVVGDAVIVSGTIGDHGMAIMSVREGLEFEAEISSDTAALSGLVKRLLDAGLEVHSLRDPTRGGLAATLCEIAAASNVGIEISDECIPIEPAVASACEILGLDPLHVANEGKLVAFVAEQDAERALALMQSDPLGQRAAMIGRVTDKYRGLVASRTAIGATRVITPSVGEQLPRIC